MEPISVVVHGVLGKMGSEVLSAVARDYQLKPICGIDKGAIDGSVTLPNGNESIPLYPDIESALANSIPNVLVDFTNAEASVHACRIATAKGVNVVIGSTGLTESHMVEIETLANDNRVGIFVAPNFAIGAVLLMHLASSIGKFFQYADIVEMHHEAKIDAPSGTAMALARNLSLGRDDPFTRPSPEKEPIEDSRGGQLNGVSIHSIRMPGRMAHHQVILGTQGQTLTLQHDTINRECYMPGVILAVNEVVKKPGLVIGLENLLKL